MNIQLGRIEQYPMQNKSGVILAQGDVVIYDNANVLGITTTIVSGFVSGRVGVVIEPNGMGIDAMGMVAFAGYVPKINLESSASNGDFIKTHTVAEQGTPHAVPAQSGDFAQVVGTGTTPAALLFGTVMGGASAGGLNDYIQVREQQTAGVDGGTFTSGAWRTRVLTTEVSDDGNHCSLAGNQITLDAGTYLCRISAPTFRVGQHKAILYNVTAGTDVLIGTSEYNDPGSYVGIFSRIEGKFILVVPSILEVRHRCSVTGNTNGFGQSSNLGGKLEVYTVAEFWKVA